MAQLGNFFARIFSAGGTRGLSGDADMVLANDGELTFFNECLRKHSTAEDFVADPARLWDTQSTFLARKGGLRAHFAAERGDGKAGVTDALIIVNAEDWKRTFKETREPWAERAAQSLRQLFTQFCEAEDFHLLHPQRPLGFQIIEDGGLEMNGEYVGLSKGEFVTGLLPNLYPKPGPASRPVIALHLAIPGAWEGYREVGRLWNDQLLFTLGNHWLDSFSHPALRAPALYRLQQYADGSFVHIISPDVADACRITTQEDPGGGPSVLTIEDGYGEVVAHLVLAMVEAEAASLPPASRPWSHTVDELAQAEAAPKLRGDSTSTFNLSRTVIPVEVDERILTLRERGALLQKVHFSRFMEGYDVYVGVNGELGTAIRNPAATVRVRGKQVSLVAHGGDVSVGGRPLRGGTPAVLDHNTRIAIGAVELEYIDLSTPRAEGWPYLGELRRTGSTIHMVFGSPYKVGRERRSKVRMPDEPHNDNIVWRPEMVAGGTIRARNGDIPKAQFYTDSIMVASEHAEIDLSHEPPLLRSIARSCYTFVRRGPDLFALFPVGNITGPAQIDILPGDELLIGNCVFEVSYPPSVSVTPVASEGARPRALSATDLADALNDPVVRPTRPATFGKVSTTDIMELADPAEPVSRPRGTLAQADTALHPSPKTPPPSSPPVAAPPPAAPPLPDASRARPFAPVVTVPNETAPFAMPSEKAPPPPVLPPVLPPPPAPPPLDVDLPAAAGLGEKGPPPPTLDLDLESKDSVLDIFDAPEPAFGRRPAGALPPPPMIWEEPEDTSDAYSDPTDIPMAPPPPVMEGARRGGPAFQPPTGARPPARVEAVSAVEAPAPPPPPPVLPPPPGKASPAAITDPVLIIDESDWQRELSRPARLTLLGWMVSGDGVVGNYRGAAFIVPENRAEAQQVFVATRYLQLSVRGRKASVKRLSTSEVRLFQGASPVEESQQLDDISVEIVRRDATGEEDFSVHLTISSAELPDPRARLLKLDLADRMVRALFTVGLPLRHPRVVELHGMTATVTYDGSRARLSDYLGSYLRPDGSFLPFFVRQADGSYQTAPEDGAPIELVSGDQFIVGNAVYVFGR